MDTNNAKLATKGLTETTNAGANKKARPKLQIHGTKAISQYCLAAENIRHN